MARKHMPLKPRFENEPIPKASCTNYDFRIERLYRQDDKFGNKKCTTNNNLNLFRRRARR